MSDRHAGGRDEPAADPVETDARSGATAETTGRRGERDDPDRETGDRPQGGVDGPASALESVASHDAGEWPRPDLDLLVVSTFGGGGIHHYTDEQVRRLEGLLSVSVHDMRMQPTGDGALRFLRGLLSGLFAIALFPLRSRPDVVHVHTSHRFSFYRASAYVLFAAYAWRVPVVIHVHGSSFDEFVTDAPAPLAAFQRLVFGAATEVVVLSEFWREAVSRRVDDRAIRVVPNAVDTGAFEGDPGADPPHVVFVSNLFERKGVGELVAAVERLSTTLDREFEVSVAGDGPLAPEVQALADVHDHVSYLGYVSEERKRSLLAEGSVYALPTYAEGLPIAMLEGMAGANAVVSTPVAAIPEVIDESRGRLVEPGDVDALADALASLVTAPDLAAEMGARNRRAVERYYSWDRVVAELLAVYDSCTSR